MPGVPLAPSSARGTAHTAVQRAWHALVLDGAPFSLQAFRPGVLGLLVELEPAQAELLDNAVEVERALC